MNRDNDKGKVLINRSLIMAATKAFLLLCIIGRLYYLQVYQADKFKCWRMKTGFQPDF